MSNNYSEQIFQSIDTIVSQRLNEVSFDKTEICKIISKDENTKGKYWVTNDVLRFEAYSADPDKSYIADQKVYVTIPSGDYGMRKIIIGSYSSAEIPKNLYTNPFDHLVVSSEITMPVTNLKITATKDGSPTITSSTKKDIIFHYSGLGQFNYIGLDFAANTGFGGTNGEFQILIDLLNDKGKSLLTNEQRGLIAFSSRQLYGNPYYLTPSLHFQHLFNFPLEYNNNKFSDLTKVKQIQVTLRQLGNFNYPNTTTINEIAINSLKLYFGFDASEDSMSENTLALVLDEPVNNLEYSTAADEKIMSIDWHNLTTNAIYNETENRQYPVSGEYYVYWLQYSESIGYVKNLESTKKDLDDCWKSTKKNYKEAINAKFKNAKNESLETYNKNLFDKYVSLYDSNQTTFKLNTSNFFIDIEESGTYWKTVQKKDANSPGAYSYTLKPCEDWKKEQIKVIIKHKDGNYIESNGLTFTNKNFRSQTGSNQGSQDTLKLTLAEGDDGIYNSYGIDNKLLSSYNLEHSLTVDYIDNTKWNKNLQKVIWKIPKNATMIKQPEGWVAKDNFYELEINHDTPNTDDGGKKITFKLSDQFSYNKTNNTIYCEITRYKNKDSNIITDTYKGSITLQFGLQGTAGTGWAFNIVQDQRALYTPNSKQNKMVLTATFEDAEGQPINKNSWASKVKWSWYQTQYNSSEATKRYTMSSTSGESITITRNDYVDCYAIIQAKITNWQDKNGNKVELTAYLPIAAGDPNYYLTGASRVVYNNQGTTPSYDEAPYILYNSNHTIVNNTDYTYSIISPETNKNKCFSINTDEGNLKPLSLLPTQIPKMALQIYDNKNKRVSYVQPILILKNGYQSKLLNEWDGNLNIDTENNKILSALIGAGVKNQDNSFTGVLMGAVGKEMSTAVTGIYGYQAGDLRFKLDEKGNFYVGTGSDNRIDFSGATNKTLTIEAKNFKLKVGNDLYFSNTAEASDKAYWLRFKDKVFFKTDGTATIGNWSVEKSCLASNFAEGYYTGKSGDDSIIGKKYNKADIAFSKSGNILLKWDTSSYKYTGKDGVEIGAVRVATKIGNNFGVTSSGILYAKGANIDGNITAKTLNLDKSIQIGEDNLILTNTEAAINANKTKINSHTTTINSHTTTINSHTTTINSHTTLINGKVSFSDLSTSGKTTINGANITTGKINAKYIDATNLTVKNANIESLSFSKITAGSGNSNSLTASNFNITGGSINFGKGVLTISNEGKIIISSTKGGYFTMSKDLDHPYVSGLNIGMYGLSIRDGSSNSNKGVQKGWIGYYGDSIRIKTDTRKKGIYLDADYLFVGYIGASSNEHEYKQGLTTTINNVDIAYGSPVTLKFKNGILYDVS